MNEKDDSSLKNMMEQEKQVTEFWQEFLNMNKPCHLINYYAIAARKPGPCTKAACF